MKMKAWAIKRGNDPLVIMSCADILPVRVGDKVDAKSASLLSPTGERIAVIYLANGMRFEEMLPSAESNSTPTSESPKDL